MTNYAGSPPPFQVPLIDPNLTLLIVYMLLAVCAVAIVGVFYSMFTKPRQRKMVIPKSGRKYEGAVVLERFGNPEPTHIFTWRIAKFFENPHARLTFKDKSELPIPDEYHPDLIRTEKGAKLSYLFFVENGTPVAPTAKLADPMMPLTSPRKQSERRERQTLDLLTKVKVPRADMLLYLILGIALGVFAGLTLAPYLPLTSKPTTTIIQGPTVIP